MGVDVGCQLLERVGLLHWLNALNVVAEQAEQLAGNNAPVMLLDLQQRVGGLCLFADQPEQADKTFQLTGDMARAVETNATFG
ncbi:hypothetical protein D9M71_500110 [compost metagenome]